MPSTHALPQACLPCKPWVPSSGPVSPSTIAQAPHSVLLHSLLSQVLEPALLGTGDSFHPGAQPATLASKIISTLSRMLSTGAKQTSSMPHMDALVNQAPPCPPLSSGTLSLCSPAMPLPFHSPWAAFSCLSFTLKALAHLKCPFPSLDLLL